MHRGSEFSAMSPYRIPAIVAIVFARLVAAQDQQTTWGSVVMTMNGERSPDIATAYPNLTPLGAQQALSAGQVMRTRYIEGPGTNVTNYYPIQGLAVNEITNEELFILAADEDFTSATAQAFLQGVYPPLGVLYVDSQSMLANGTVVQYPIGGYQYPTIDVISPLDFNYVWIAGDNGCNQYLLSANDYLNSKDYNDTYASSLPFYQRLIPIVYQDLIPSSMISYHNAYNLWEYANYQYIHNKTVFENLDSGDLELLRNYASQAEFARNGNLSVSGLTSGDMIQAIAGQTYSGAVLSLLGQTVGSHGSSAKLSMLFGKYPVFMSFFALSGLSNRNDEFKSIPEPGSVMVFELFSKDLNTTAFPDPRDLWVRFLFRNGTDPSKPLLSYPLFGNGNSATDMPWNDFLQGIEAIAISDLGTWCETCSSLAMYCSSFEGNTSGGSSNTSGSGSSSGGSKGLSPTIAGILGAVVTIAALILILAAAMVCFGVRFYRNSNKRQSSLGGFKGAEKLASDTDLTVAAAKGAAGASIVRHERVGSWELGDAKKPVDMEEGSSVGGNSRTAAGSHQSMDRVVSMVDYSKRDDDDAISIVSPYQEATKADERI